MLNQLTINFPARSSLITSNSFSFLKSIIKTGSINSRNQIN